MQLKANNRLAIKTQKRIREFSLKLKNGIIAIESKGYFTIPISMLGELPPTALIILFGLKNILNMHYACYWNDQKIADFLGVSRTTVTEYLKEFEKNGLIEIKKHKGKRIIKILLTQGINNMTINLKKNYDMSKPNSSIINDIESMVLNIETKKKEIKKLENNLNNLLHILVNEFDSKKELIKAIRYIYWELSEVSGKAIARNTLGVSPNKLVKIIGPLVLKCVQCKSPIYVKSRTHKEDLIRKFKSKDNIICESCEKKELNKEREKRNKEYEIEEKSYEKRLIELKSMPYQEYLNTPEWQNARNRALKRANYSCSICNASNVILDVHHRTYDNIGEERYNDLVVLCRTCHEIFHENSRLIG